MLILSTNVGTLIGALSGYFGEKLDNFIMRIIEVIK